MRIKPMFVFALLVAATFGRVSAEELSNLALASRQEVPSLVDLLEAPAPNAEALAATYTIDDLLGTQVLCGGPGAPCRSNSACCEGFCARPYGTYGWCL